MVIELCVCVCVCESVCLLRFRLMALYIIKLHDDDDDKLVELNLATSGLSVVHLCVLHLRTLFPQFRSSFRVDSAQEVYLTLHNVP